MIMMSSNFLLSCIIYLIYIIIRSNETIHMLQQNKYNAKGTYVKWLVKNKDKAFYGKSVMFLVLLFFLIYKNSMVLLVFFNVIYLILIIDELTRGGQNKLPLKFTSRVKRLIVTNTLVHALIIFLLSMIVKNSNLVYIYIVLGFIAYINSISVLLSIYINTPIEKCVGLYYKNMAKNKLKSMNNLKVIGITGSYGKTSSKNILNDILNIKYNSVTTPKNFNTPFGLMITINNYIDKFNDVFIAEMGACQEGDINELCELVRPKYGIITTIGVAHLATFKTRENIQKTKFELIENLPSDGIGILNADDEWQKSYNIRNNCLIKWIGIENDADVMAKNIKLTPNGTKFDIVFKGDDSKYKFETKLLGYHNVYNILAAVALGKEFGMSVEQLQAGVSKVKPVEHRLELKKNGDITIIDDAYNSNPVGSSMALDVLKMMPGKHIVVTPGMIELGDEEDEKNREFGKHMAKCVDEVILVGKKKTKPIYDGLIDEKFDSKKIHVINDVMKAFDMIQELKDDKTFVLLENDLPDIFNEK